MVVPVKWFRRRRREQSREDVLREAREAARRVRADAAELERYRQGKQADPATQMTQNQRLGSGG
jgi:hypothetical protein